MDWAGKVFASTQAIWKGCATRQVFYTVVSCAEAMHA